MADLSKPPRADEIMRSLAGAIRERRFESVPHLLSLLARTSPADAEVVYEAIMLAASPGSAAVAQGSLFDLATS